MYQRIQEKLNKVTDLKVPSVFKSMDGKEYSVVAMDDGVFELNKVLKKITLPESITTYGKKIFKNCDNLGLYIHIPFCKSICNTFCTFGCLINLNQIIIFWGRIFWHFCNNNFCTRINQFILGWHDIIIN